MSRSHRRKNTLRLGDHNSISDISGQKFKRSEMKLTWQNWLVHKSEWFAKQPQLDIRPPKEIIAVRSTRTQDVPKGLENPPITPAQYL